MKPIIRSTGAILGTLRAEYRQLANRYFGKIERFDGDARQICQQIVERLWQGNFYRTSLGHFDFFWMRDFGTVADSLVKLGHGDRVRHTLGWALNYYRRAGTVTTCIDQAGNCFNAPGRAVDSLPWLLHCLHVSKYPLTLGDRAFLNRQLEKYQKTFLESDGRLKSMKFAELRDAVMYDRSAYAISLVGRLAHCANHMGLSFPFHRQFYRQELIDHYWTGDYFKADRQTDAFSAECALFPFHLNIVDDDTMAHKTLDYIGAQKLNQPYPLLYTNDEKAFAYHWWMTAPFMPHYAGNSVWSWHGEFYLHLLRRLERPEYQQEYDKFAGLIERHKTFPEMLNADGSWYYAPIYRGDPGMVWAALFLELSVPKIDNIL